jgi:transcriptional regulator with XRE-family HTH domain
MDKEKFGKFVAGIRKEKGMTQKDLSEKLHVSDKAVSKWERGLSFPDISILEPLSEAMDVSVLEMLRGERMEEEKTLSIEEAEAVLDHSISISEEEITRKHWKNKFIIIFCCILLMLLVSVVMNIMNYGKPDKSGMIWKQNIAYKTVINEEGNLEFVNPDQAFMQIIQDLQKYSHDEVMTDYLEILKESYLK